MVILVDLSNFMSKVSFNSTYVSFLKFVIQNIDGQTKTNPHWHEPFFKILKIQSVPSNVPKIDEKNASSEPIPMIEQLYSPRFPLEVVREFVMGAILEAVEINQVHNRDPIGGSNENLFL